MRLRYFVLLTATFCFHIIAWYYVTAFCSVYITSGTTWIYGGIISLLIGYITELLFFMCHIIIRAHAKAYSDIKFWRLAYFIILKMT